MISAERSAPATPSGVAGHDLEILVRQTPARDALTFELKAEELGINYQEFGPVRLHRSPGQYFTELFRRLDPPRPRGRKTRSTGSSGIRRVERNLRIAGSFLIRELLPPDLRDVLWHLQSRVGRAQIQSDEPWVPWELLRLERREDGRVEELGPFLCEAFQLTQWRRGCDVPSRLGRPPCLRIRSIAVVAPRHPRVETAAAELAFLFGLRKLGCRVERIEARVEPILEAFASGRHDLFHFAGHGEEFLDNDPDSAAIFLEGQETLRPFHLAAEAGRLGVCSPLIFLNACHTGKQGLSLTGQGGWATRFLQAGAGAFVGSHWAISDQRALAFCKAFYRALIAGEGLAQATHSARFAIRQPGEPTWLAYTAFGHPHLSCRWPNGPGEASRKNPATLSRTETRESPCSATATPSAPRPAAVPKPAPVSEIVPAPSSTRSEPPRGEEPSQEEEERSSAPSRPIEEIPVEPVHPPVGSAVESRIHERTGLELVRVPAGKYPLGSDEADTEARPEHLVFLSELWISRRPVSNEGYRRFLAASDYGVEPRFWGDARFDAPELPVVGVSWWDALAYCEWARLQLPSEAQWEAAARGTDRRKYPWGDSSPSPSLCCFGSRKDGPIPVDRNPGGAGPFGTLGQAGTVWEWCLDTWRARAYRGRHLARDPVVRDKGLLKVVRGGSWMSPANELLASYRLPVPQGMRFNNQGFRCVWMPGD